MNLDRKELTIATAQMSMNVSEALAAKINNGHLTSSEIAEIKEQGLKQHLALLTRSNVEALDIISFQETFYAPFFYCVEQSEILREFAEGMRGKVITTLQKFAKDNRLAIVAPIHEENPGAEKDFNTAVFIDCNGNIVGKYRKILIPDNDGFHEDYFFMSGDLGLPVFDIETKNGPLKAGAYICHDRHNYEGFNELVKRGAEVIFEPSATVYGTSYKHWEATAIADAFRGNVFVVKTNRHGKEGLGSLAHETYYGESIITGPDGSILAQATSDQDIVISAKVNIDEAMQNGHDRYPKKRAEFLNEGLRANLFREPPTQEVEYFSG